jgi:hypothetical protein
MNDSHTYAIFNYEHDGLQWAGNVVIGYMSSDRHYFYSHSLSQTAAAVSLSSSVNASNIGVTGQLMYSLTGNDDDVGVRLAAGTSQVEGQVEVLVDETWGGICNKLWDLEDKSVACRQLGFPSVTTTWTLSNLIISKHSRRSTSFAMSRVACSGNESRLQDCPFSNDTADCGSSSSAVVICGKIILPIT